MTYELWDIIGLTEGEVAIPFTRLYEDDSFIKVYDKFLKHMQNNELCVIIVNKDDTSLKYKSISL